MLPHAEAENLFFQLLPGMLCRGKRKSSRQKQLSGGVAAAWEKAA